MLIEFNHSGIPDAELKPEKFNEQQIAVLAALKPEEREKIKAGCPVELVDLNTGATVAFFNRKNISTSKYQMESLARTVLEGARKFYSDPENVKKYEGVETQSGVRHPFEKKEFSMQLFLAQNRIIGEGSFNKKREQFHEAIS